MSLGKSVTVITPTTGSSELIDALISVEAQDYEGPIDHLVVVDGQEFLPKVIEIVERSGTNPTVMVLPYNTGADGWNGHRIYAAVPALVNSDYIAFLDQDNWYDSNHVSSLAAKLDKNSQLELAFSLRSIYTKDKIYVTDDNCESLGLWPIWNSGGRNFLIDTSCFFFRADFIRRTGRKWLYPYNADARYSMALKTSFSGKYETTGLYTLGYRLGGSPNSVSKDFFMVGNIYSMEMYPGGNYPWTRKN